MVSAAVERLSFHEADLHIHTAACLQQGGSSAMMLSLAGVYLGGALGALAYASPFQPKYH